MHEFKHKHWLQQVKLAHSLCSLVLTFPPCSLFCKYSLTLYLPRSLSLFLSLSSISLYVYIYIELQNKERDKKWLKFKKRKLKTAVDNNRVKNKTKNSIVFSNYKLDNVTGVDVVDN